VAGSCEYGDEPSGSGATELVNGLDTNEKLLKETRNSRMRFLRSVARVTLLDQKDEDLSKDPRINR
jgi:hypothetical protein